MRVITKSDVSLCVRPICLSRVWLQTELDDTKSYYQLIVKITISREKRRIAKLWKNWKLALKYSQRRRNHSEGVFSWREGVPPNRATRLEGLTHSPPLHAAHTNGKWLRGLSFERLLSTTNKMAHQRNFFHLISASCTGTGLLSAWDSSITLISSDWLSFCSADNTG